MASTHELFEFFITNYKEFDLKFKSNRHNDDSLLCFGISGAGKSTFLARLLSRMSPEEFLENFPKEDNSFVTIEDVRIGSSISSVTIIPKQYSIGDLRIYDMPGLRDTDRTRETTINILHKCLLSRLNSNKFLVVLDIRLIDQKRILQLVNDYHSSLSVLFGNTYRTNINNVFFVLTHNDTVQYDRRRFTLKLKEVIVGATEINDNPNLMMFLNRLKNNFIIVNYKEDSRETLTSELKEMLMGEKDNIRTSDLKIEVLDVHSDALNNRCQEELTSIENNYLKEIKPAEVKITDNLREIEQKKKIILDIEDTVKLLHEQVSKCTNENERLRKRIEEIKENVIGHRSKISEIDFRIETNKKHEKLFQNELTSLNTVKLRTDLSISKVFGYEIDTIIVKPIEPYVEDVILVVKYENSDKLLSQHINNNGSLIPSDIEKIKSFSNEVVLYNSYSKKHDKGMVFRAQANKNPREMHVTATYNGQFKLHYYSTALFPSTNEYKTCLEFYGRNLQELERNKAHFEHEIELCEEEIESHDFTITKNLQTNFDVNKSIEQNKTNHDDLADGLQALIKANLMEIEKVTMSLKTSYVENKTFSRISEIKDIFYANKLDSKLDNLIRNLLSEFEKSSRLMNSIKKECESIDLKRYTQEKK